MRRYRSVVSVSRSTSRVTAWSSALTSSASEPVPNRAWASASWSISTLRPMEDRGLRTSCATCAETRPTAASRSARSSACCWRASASSRSSSARVMASNSRPSWEISSSPGMFSWPV